jgi:hypothetical protein
MMNKTELPDPCIAAFEVVEDNLLPLDENRFIAIAVSQGPLQTCLPWQPRKHEN